MEKKVMSKEEFELMVDAVGYFQYHTHANLGGVLSPYDWVRRFVIVEGED